MCRGGHGDGVEAHGHGKDEGPAGIPDWKTVELPPDHILAHLTDAHCHPTDLDQSNDTYDHVKLGGIASMATVPEDQDKVRKLGEDRGWRDGMGQKSRIRQRGARVVSCFGYHPWFSHRYTLGDTMPSKEDHYSSIFFPPCSVPARLSNTRIKNKPKTNKDGSHRASDRRGPEANGTDGSVDAQSLFTARQPLPPPDSAQNSPRRKQEREQLRLLLPYLPDPVPFAPLLQSLRDNIQQTKDQGRLVLLGEVGLDGTARVRWPESARHLYTEKYEPSKEEDKAAEQEEWRRLTLFKVSMAHQVDLLCAQLEVAVQLGVGVSLHCVGAAGPTMDVLLEMRRRFGPRFTNGVNIDLHSGGGWSPQFFTQGAKQLSNLYASPSIFITSRLQSATDLIRAIPPDRILVESDSHNVTLCTRVVWAAVLWIAHAKEWTVEGSQDVWKEEEVGDNEEEWDDNGRLKERNGGGVVHRLERNWARFMGLIEPYD